MIATSYTYYPCSDIATSGAVTHRYYVRDYLGSTRAVIDEEGNVLQSTANLDITIRNIYNQNGVQAIIPLKRFINLK